MTSDSLELSPPVFSILSGLIEEKVGLHYGLMDKDLLREKASGRAQEAGFESLLDYYYFLRYDEGGQAELNQLVETLVVNETYFFREWPAIRTLVETHIAPLCAVGERPRIWSAACATGEEPLSLAMILDSLGLLDKVEIVASDISLNALAKAKSGSFGRRAVRQIPEQVLHDKYISPLAQGYRVQERLLNFIRWEQHNLLLGDEYPRLGLFDAIICRNVLIYFSDSTIKNILENFSRSLAPQGLLLVGVSESLLRYGSGFQGEERAGSFLYRKAGLT